MHCCHHQPGSALLRAAPGPNYWQQRADYVIDVELDEATHALTGRETVTYYNRSPHALAYLWLQVDQNAFAGNSLARQSESTPGFDDLDAAGLQALVHAEHYRGDVRIDAVTDAAGAALPYTIADTYLRLDLPVPLPAGQQITFSLAWRYEIATLDAGAVRSGYGIPGADGNAIYWLGQWYPRMAAYTDYGGWQLEPLLGNGEFTLEFGNYLVRISVPADHIVAATGSLQNPEQVLTATQRKRLAQAGTAAESVFIVTPDEAAQTERSRATGRKTWVFEAADVRDFAFASSRKYAWDARAVPGYRALAMSFYPKEGLPLWVHSTRAIVHALQSYSRFTFDYPYPVAQAVSVPMDGPAGGGGGMEYPMISFNGPLSPQGKTSNAAVEEFVALIIHETGHNYVPMILNTDERHWAWLDEGLTTFLEGLAVGQGRADFPGNERLRPRAEIAAAMLENKTTPIMTAADYLPEPWFVHLAYSKPAAALSVLRESILGHERFDFALRTFAQRWKFKRPQPADFFRSMEDAAGASLDWFWRGWFFSTGTVDMGLGVVREYESDALPSGLHVYTVEIINRGVVMPIPLALTYADGSTSELLIPAEIWRHDSRRAFKRLVTQQRISALRLDPRGELFDADPDDNTWAGAAVKTPIKQKAR